MKLNVVTKINKTIEFEKGKNLLELLQENGFNISADCSGHGKCGKCIVKVNYGIDINLEYVSACKTFLYKDAEIELIEKNYNGDLLNISDEAARVNKFIVVVDIGTTTLVVSLVDEETRRTVKTVTALNPQSVFGADVMSRIEASKNGKIKLMRDLIFDKISGIINEFQKIYVRYNAEKIIITGNTVMLHIFANEEILSLGVAPYIPQFLITKRLNEIICGKNYEIVLMPSSSAFIGSDVVGGAVAVRLMLGNNILVDLGTNGEIVMSFNGKLFATSCAMGPCFEGAEISCGSGGVDGAICKAKYVNRYFTIETVGGKSAIGICGSGLVDIISAALENGMIDKSGLICTGSDKIFIDKKICITQKDVRAFQLAKSALVSGLKVLSKKIGLSFDKIDNIFIAGGFGYYVNQENAVKIGLIPNELKDKIVCVGNAALSGAVLAINEEVLRETETVAKSITTVNLSEESGFFDEFIANMDF